MELAPIVLFVYNRPWHTKQTLEALMKNELAIDSELFIYADGPKENVQEEDRKKINEVREIIKSTKWCKNVTIVESDTNNGLASSVIKGVTEIINKYERVIVLEDDLVCSKYFLEFINEALNVYEGVKNIYSINGFMFPITIEEAKTVLLPFTSTWGFATWKDRWEVFDFNMAQKEFIIKNKLLQGRFNLAKYKYSSMLNYIDNSWGIRWYYSVFKRNGLNVFPSKSLIKNIGLDGSGTNCENEDFKSEFYEKRIPIYKSNQMDLEFYSLYLNFFSMQSKWEKIKKFFNSLL